MLTDNEKKQCRAMKISEIEYASSKASIDALDRGASTAEAQAAGDRIRAAHAASAAALQKAEVAREVQALTPQEKRSAAKLNLTPEQFAASKMMYK